MYLEGFLEDTITNITQKRKKRRKTVGIREGQLNKQLTTNMQGYVQFQEAKETCPMQRCKGIASARQNLSGYLMIQQLH